MLDSGCLHGTTRAFVAENHYVETVLHNVEELRIADHVFLTSAGLGLAEVSGIRFDEGIVEFESIYEEFYSSGRLKQIRWQ